MNNYDQYVKEINNIFSCLEKLKKNWNNSDNRSYIADIDRYRDHIVKCATKIEELESKKVSK